MENRSVSLKKRIKTDRIVSLVFVAIELLIAVMQFKKLIGGDDYALKRSIHAFTGAVSLFIVYLILRRIGITGKPFDNKIVTLIRACSITLIAGGVLPFFAAMILGVTRDGGFSVELGNVDILVPLIGVTVGIISEIFVYGRDLQEDNDLIA